jgi:hypothetical protein
MLLGKPKNTAETVVASRYYFVIYPLETDEALVVDGLTSGVHLVMVFGEALDQKRSD